MGWKRPSKVAIPTVWARFEGKKPLQNGKIPRFRVQDLTPDFEEEVMSHMTTFFFEDEALCSHLDVASDEEAVAEFVEIWRKCFTHRMVLVAVLDNPEDFEGVNLPAIAGCNITFPTVPSDVDPHLKNKKTASILNYVNLVSHKVDCFKKYNVPVILYALGLYVPREFRGQGLGEEILKARWPLCRAMGITLTTTVFTGPASQAVARKAGLRVLAEATPDQYTEDKTLFQNSKSECLHLSIAEIN